MSSTPGSGPSDTIDAARRPPQDTRPEMLRLLVHEFLKQPIRNEAAESRFVTLAIRLIEAVDVPVAAKHVRELAPHPAVPRALALYLATAPLSLAGPFLRLSPVLGEDDLARLAEQAAPSHLAAMAARRDVSPGLAKRIAELVHRRHEAGDSIDVAPESPVDDEAATSPVAEITAAIEPEPEAAHPDAAEIPESVATFVAAPPATDVSMAEAAITLAEAAATQPVAETSPAVAAHASDDTVPTPDAPVTEAPEPEVRLPEAPSPEASSPQTVTETPLAEAQPLATAPPEEPAAAEAAAPAVLPSAEFFAAGPEERATLIARLVTLPPLPLAERPAAPPAGFIDALLDAARTAENGALAKMLERTLGVSEESAARIVADETGQSMAVAARALGLSFAILSRVLFRLHPVAGRSTGEMARLAEMFDSLPLASAQHLVASWRGSRRPGRERAEEAPSMRSFAQPHPVAQASAPSAPKTSEVQPRKG